MVVENYTNITWAQAIEGSITLEPSMILTLVILCFGIAIGAQWGFDKIYSLNRLEKFRRYKSDLVSNLKSRLKKISSKDDKEFSEEINEFVDEWQTFQIDVGNCYNRLLFWRKEILIVFALAGISYFLRFIRPDLLLWGYKIVIISNTLFIFGLLSIFIFAYQIIKLETEIAKYIIDKTQDDNIR